MHTNKLRFHREKLSKSIENACDFFGVDRVSITRWERGYHYPQLQRLGEFEKFYGAKVQSLWPGVFE